MKIESFAVFALCPFLLLSAFGAETVTLDTLVQQALAQNPELKFYEAEIAAAKAGRRTAGLLANPEVSGSIGEKTGRGNGLSAEGVAWSYEAKLRQMGKWRPDSVEHFREAAETADRHYRLGAVPISTYMELQKQYLEAVEGLLDTKKEALEAAAQLELLTGLQPPLASTKPEEKP